MRRPHTLRLLATFAPLLVACRQDMHDQPRFEPFERSAFFEDRRSARPQVPGTVARGQLHTDAHFFTGQVGGEATKTFPFAVTRKLLERGRERFRINCSVCHGRAGFGDGMAVQRGLRKPPSFHAARLRQAPPGHFFQVITEGFGAMYDLADRVVPRDRWAIAAYIRVLQRSQNARLKDVPAKRRPGLLAEER